ncbi:MAG: hypothetical protein R3183_00640 [Oleiphilaceae bacterium]|nr:hypothetical protein [Oleiphilaceae bacterium]
MKKLFGFLLIVVVLLGGAAYWLMGNIDKIVHEQIEVQGTKALGVPVAVDDVVIRLMDGLGEIRGFSIANPKGFSDAPLMSFASVRLDIDTEKLSTTPLVIEEVSIDSASALYELNAQAQGNVNVLLDQLKRNMPASSGGKTENTDASSTSEGDIRLVVKRVVIKDTQLKLDLTGIGQKAYDETLPTFSASNIGGSEGLPPAELGAKIAEAMLDNLVDAAAAKQKERLKQKAIDKAKEKVQEELGDKLKDNDKVKGLMEKFGHNF